MRLTKLAVERRDALFVLLHRAIREEAEKAARAELRGAATERLLAKAIADGTARALFQMFTAMDAVGDPAHWQGPWDAVHLAADADGEDSDMLHDLFFETYHVSET